MMSRSRQILAGLAALALAGAAFAQPADHTVGPAVGNSSTGAGRPADGAIKGGSIIPGENAGVPTDKAKNRCNDLEGTLREQCLARERESASGGTTGEPRLPEIDVAKPPPTREAPPPQNPR